MNHLSCNQRGRFVELQAMSLFIQAGFEVFDNIVKSGPADFVVWDGETFYPIDTKKVNRYVKKDGSVSYSWSPSQGDRVLYIGWCIQDGWMWLSEPPEALSNVF